MSAGDNAGINFCNSLLLEDEKFDVIAADTNVFRLLQAVGHSKLLLPDPSSPDYLPALNQAIHQTGAEFLYAADTNLELQLVSEHRDKLAIRQFLPPSQAVEIYEDKWRSHQYFVAAGLPQPETVLVHTPEDLHGLLEKHGRVWLRAIRGSGGKGALPTDSVAMATAWLDRHSGWGNFTAAQVLTKKMATWSGLWHHGKLVICQGRRRLHWEYGELSPAGITGITGAQSTCDDPELHDLALRTIASVPIAPHGIVSVDFTYDSRGRPNPTEIQASRFYTSIYFLARAGLNFPARFVELGMEDDRGTAAPLCNPLPNDLVWLKAVDREPILTHMADVERFAVQHRVTAAKPVAAF